MEGGGKLVQVYFFENICWGDSEFVLQNNNNSLQLAHHASIDIEINKNIAKSLNVLNKEKNYGQHRTNRK